MQLWSILIGQYHNLFATKKFYLQHEVELVISLVTITKFTEEIRKLTRIQLIGSVFLKTRSRTKLFSNLVLEIALALSNLSSIIHTVFMCMTHLQNLFLALMFAHILMVVCVARIQSI